jgi:hypothetical protein
MRVADVDHKYLRICLRRYCCGLSSVSATWSSKNYESTFTMALGTLLKGATLWRRLEKNRRERKIVWICRSWILFS